MRREGRLESKETEEDKVGMAYLGGGVVTVVSIIRVKLGKGWILSL